MSKKEMPIVVRAYLGEVFMGTIIGNGDHWQISAPHVACSHIVEQNRYNTYREAKNCVSKFVPEPCQNFIRWTLLNGDVITLLDYV